MYLEETRIDASHFLQGDIILNFDFPHIEKEGDNLITTVKRENIILLSQSCDLQNRPANNRFICCPLFNDEQLKESYLRKDNVSEVIASQRIENLKENKKFDLIYLPHTTKIRDSFVFFPKLASIPIETLSGKAPDLRLSDRGRHFLAHRIQNYLGRAFDPTK